MRRLSCLVIREFKRSHRGMQRSYAKKPKKAERNQSSASKFPLVLDFSKMSDAAFSHKAVAGHGQKDSRPALTVGMQNENKKNQPPVAYMGSAPRNFATLKLMQSPAVVSILQVETNVCHYGPEQTGHVTGPRRYRRNGARKLSRWTVA
jgi:hypothetical protein